MIFYLKEDFLDADASDLEIATCINSLLDSVRHGHHLLYASRKLLKAFCDNENLSAAARIVANHLHSKQAEIGAIANQVTVKVSVSTKCSGVMKLSNNEWILGADVFAVRPAVKIALLAENERDAKLLEAAANHYMIFSRIQGMRISVSRYGGGGDTTGDQLQSLLRERERFCLCVTDSDRAYPEDTEKATSRKCRNVIGEYSWVAEHICLEARELENIVPLSWYELARPNPIGDKVQAIRSIERRFGRDFSRFGDIKKGLTRRDLAGIGVGSPKRKFWENLVVDENGLESVCDSCGTAGNDGNACASCNEYVFPSLGARIVETLVRAIDGDHAPASLIRLARNDLALDDWLAVGRRVFEWGISKPPMRI